MCQSWDLDDGSVDPCPHHVHGVMWDIDSMGASQSLYSSLTMSPSQAKR